MITLLELFPMNYEVPINLVIFFAFTLWVHEGVHYKTAEKFGLKPHLGLDWKGFYTYTEIEPTPAQERDMLWDAIILGVVPVFVSGLLIYGWFVILLASYLIGILPDIKILRENYAKSRTQ